MNLHIIKPYDDINLVYKNNRYYLARDYCKANFDVTTTSDELLDREIRRNTNNVYEGKCFYIKIYVYK